jgi:hypothetical protein
MVVSNLTKITKSSMVERKTLQIYTSSDKAKVSCRESGRISINTKERPIGG